MSRKSLTVGLSLIGAGAGYYLYSAGGNPKVAEKMAERDAARASNSVQSHLPGSAKEAQKQGEQWAKQAGAKIDNASAEAKAKGNEVDAKLAAEWSKAKSKAEEGKAKAATELDYLRKDANKNIDKFDSTVEKKTAEAKSGISSWFGGGK